LHDEVAHSQRTVTPNEAVKKLQAALGMIQAVVLSAEDATVDGRQDATVDVRQDRIDECVQETADMLREGMDGIGREGEGLRLRRGAKCDDDHDRGAGACSSWCVSCGYVRIHVCVRVGIYMYMFVCTYIYAVTWALLRVAELGPCQRSVYHCLVLCFARFVPDEDLVYGINAHSHACILRNNTMVLGAAVDTCTVHAFFD
jgi:hypothetical protein